MKIEVTENDTHEMPQRAIMSKIMNIPILVLDNPWILGF